MVYTEVLTSVIAVLVAVVIGIQYYLIRFLSANSEKTDIVVNSKLDDMKTYIEESISGIFESDEELTEEQQQKQEAEQAEQFVQTVTVAMISAFRTDEMKQTIAEIIAPIAPSVLPPEDMAKLGEMEGAAVVNMISSINPFMPKIVENFMGSDWQDQVQKNPQMFVALLSKLQQSGALSVFESFLGGSGGAANQQQPSSNNGSKRISGW